MSHTPPPSPPPHFAVPNAPFNKAAHQQHSEDCGELTCRHALLVYWLTYFYANAMLGTILCLVDLECLRARGVVDFSYCLLLISDGQPVESVESACRK